ncbi:MAG: ABC transporter permease [Phototrophicales bacterium]|nr:MAG: ABC transporter permease [Phototrophicales bacterium]
MLVPLSKKVFLGVLQFATIVLSILTLLFFLQRLTGDPAAVLVGHNATPELLEAVREEMGLNQPIYVQYATFIGKALQLDFGESNRFQKSALELVMARFPSSLLLSVSALTLAVLVGVPIGIYAALYFRRADGIIVNLFAGVLQSLPSFWLGLVLLLIFSVQLGWVGSVANLEDNLLRRMALPTITLASFYVARLIRLVRSGLIEELNEAHILTAHSKGLQPRRVLFVHALRNALIPVLAFVTLDLSFMIGGSIIVETLFSYSGMGDQMVKAIFNRDYALVQASMFVIVIFVLVINMISNRLYTFIDPRIRA